MFTRTIMWTTHYTDTHSPTTSNRIKETDTTRRMISVVAYELYMISQTQTIYSNYRAHSYTIFFINKLHSDRDPFSA